MNVTVGNVKGVAVIDADCPFRPCFRLGFDKGSFTQGVGYTRYHTDAKGRTVEHPVCMTRHLNGCPHVGITLRCAGIDNAWCPHVFATHLFAEHEDDEEERPTPDGPCPLCGSIEWYWLSDVLADPAPCCDHPDVPKPRGKYPPYRQRCHSCGTSLTGRRLELARVS